MNRLLILVIILPLCSASSQESLSPRLKGLRVYGATSSDLPIVSLQGRGITWEFDLTDTEPPNLYMRFVHCDMNWQPTPTSFVNDDMRDRTRYPLPFEPAPVGVDDYRFHYTVRIPDAKLFERFWYSGNYRFEIWDEDQSILLAQGKFFVTENTVRPTMRVSNYQLPSQTNPLNEVHRVDVAFRISEQDTGRNEVLYPQQCRVVDIYKNVEWSRPYRIDVDDTNPWTFVEGFGTSNLVFRVENVLPGNEYRTMDIRNAELYPEHQVLRSREGADVSRYLSFGPRDHDGAATLVRGTRYADYVPFQFELRWDGTPFDTVYVVGSFNNWRTDDSSRMEYRSGRFVRQVSMRRGAYDYQYAVGRYDWITLEGNDWRTSNNYTAIIYYHDYRFGGFDRILGSARARSAGNARLSSD